MNLKTTRHGLYMISLTKVFVLKSIDLHGIVLPLISTKNRMIECPLNSSGRNHLVMIQVSDIEYQDRMRTGRNESIIQSNHLISSPPFQND